MDLEWAADERWKPWLSISIRRDPDVEASTWRIRPYSKPGNSHAFTHFASYVPIGCFKGIVIGKLLSAENRTDNDMDRQREWRTSRIRLLFRGYPPEFIERVRLAWLAKRRAPPSSRRDSSHTALSQDMLGETFVVLVPPRLAQLWLEA